MAKLVNGGDPKKFQLNAGFTLELIIGEYDYEPDLQNMRIISTFNGPYPMFIFNLNIKPIEMIRHKLLGDIIINLTIHLKDPDGHDIVDSFNVDLLYLSGEYSVPVSNQILEKDESLQDQRAFTIRAVPEHAYRVMTYNINKIYRNQSVYFIMNDLTMDIIDNIESDTLFQLNMDQNGINNIPIEQVILPPTVFKNHCGYLLNEFGLYDGFGVIYSSIGHTGDFTNKSINYKVMNITDRWLHAKPVFKIIQLANDEKDTDKITNNFTEGNFKDYYIYSEVTTKYVANGVYSAVGNDNYYINKPVDKFCRIDNIITSEYVNRYVEYPKLTDNISERKRYISNHICHNRDIENYPLSRVYGDYDDTLIQDEYWLSAKLNKAVFNMTRINVTVDRNFPLHLFTNIGEPIEFESRTSDYDNLNGRYILFSTDIKLRREQGGWKSSADITFTRPNWSRDQINV